MKMSKYSKWFQIRWTMVIGIPILVLIAFIVWDVVIVPCLFGVAEPTIDVGRVRLILQLETEVSIIDLDWNSDSTLLAFADEGDTVSVVNVETGEIDLQLNMDEEEIGGISAIAWDTIGNRLLIAHSLTEVWDYPNRQWLDEFEFSSTQMVMNEYVSEGDVDWNPSESLMATVWRDGSIIIWDVQSGERLELPAHEDSVHKVSWSPDGNMLASAGRDGRVFVWDVSALQQLKH